MRNLLSLQIETKVSLAIITIAVIIFLLTIFKSLDNFNEFTKRFDTDISQYEKIRVQEGP